MNSEIFINYFIIIILNILFFISVYSMGLITSSFLKLNLKNKNQVIWIGIIFLPIILMIINFGLAITTYINLILFICFLLYLINKDKKILSHFKEFILHNKITIIFYFLCLIILTKQNPLYDTGLYHLQAIKWINEHSIVPGLSNLNDRLGFNIIYYYLSSYLILPFSNNLSHISVSLFIFVMTFNTIIKLNYDNLKNKYLIIWIVLIGLSFKRYLVASASPDLIVFCQEIIVLIYLINYLYSSKPNDNDLLFIFIFCCFIFYNKLSSIFFCFSFILVLVFLFKEKLLKILNAKILLIFSLFFIIWIFRSYVLSGMPLYPNTIFNLEFLDWSANNVTTKAMVVDFYNWSINSTVKSNIKISFFENFNYWLLKLESYQKLYILIIILLTLVCIINHRKIIIKKEFIYIFFILVGNIIFILFNLPQIRFLETSLLGLIVTLFIVAHESIRENSILKNYIINYFLYFNLFIFFIIITFFKSIDTFSNKWKSSMVLDNNNFKNIKNYRNFESFVTISGDQCWGWHLPCTFRLNENLIKKNFVFVNKIFFYYSLK